MTDEPVKKRKTRNLTYPERDRLRKTLEACAEKIKRERPDLDTLTADLSKTLGIDMGKNSVREMCKYLGIEWVPKVAARARSLKAENFYNRLRGQVAALEEKVAELQNLVGYLYEKLGDLGITTPSFARKEVTASSAGGNGYNGGLSL